MEMQSITLYRVQLKPHFRGKCIAFNAYVRREKRSQINYHLEKLEKEEQIKLNNPERRRKGRISKTGTEEIRFTGPFNSGVGGHCPDLYDDLGIILP